MEGYQIIDYDGRPVADEAFEEDALALAEELNGIAGNRKAVAKRLAAFGELSAD
jgi:hypothetical protein